MKNILVIGGNRFFGRRLVELLLNRGDQITLLNRGQLSDGFGDRIKRIKLDRREVKKNHPQIESRSWDVIYDQVCFDAEEAQAACEAFEGRVGHYVFTSSQSVYEQRSNLKEEDFNPFRYTFEQKVDRQSDYSEAKRQAEATFFRLAKFPVSAVRFPIVLGEDDYTLRLKFHVDRVKSEKPIYFPNILAKISFIQSIDAAKALLRLSEGDQKGPINCCSKASIELKKVIEMIERVTHKTAQIVNEATLGEDSPFGLESDWTMNVDQLDRFKFSAEPISNWLPKLIDFYASDLQKR